jgi:ribosomal protein S15P/S13E
MATTSAAVSPKKTSKAKATTATTTEPALEAQVTALETQVATLTAQVTNLTNAIEGQDIDGDGIPDVSGLTDRMNKIVGFLRRKYGEGPMENTGVY